ncbi:isoleucine--tRNA ligase, mitochondrial-like [Glandiceps talaboti]
MLSVRNVMCWRCFLKVGNPQRRRYATKKYSSTLNLPKTSFELWGAGARENEIQKSCGFTELYSWQRKQRRDKEFCLHDGPPYANGDPHVGHAVNKILKDILNRYKLLQGFKVHYIPGWDCHGLPIEIKALSLKPEDFNKLSPQEIRHTARKFAEKTIKTQMKAFKRWGVMADWNNCYYTFDKEFEVSQLQVFYDMYDKGYVFRDLKPVNWSPSARTALAEAELEYNANHISPSLYVKFPVERLPDKLVSTIGAVTSLYCLIWTTTPWTLPANEAVCYMPNKNYCVVRNVENGEHYILAAERLQEVSEVIGAKFIVTYTIPGNDLDGVVCQHPFVRNKTSPLLPANHVKMSTGTGLVHTAPAHGDEDYVVGVENNLSLKCMVDEDGLYTEDVGEELKFKNVLTEANDIVLRMLESDGRIAYVGKYQHSYPYDWRTKKPVIIRASTQWFIDTAALKDKALQCIAEIPMRPKHANNSMSAHLAGRTNWCISRQRVWGVPLPVFYDKHTKQPLLTRETTDHVINLIKQHGSDCWWTLPMDQLLPKSVLSKSGVDEQREFIRGDDILDIWFDSGSSWAHVLKDTGNIADVYWEGEDQYGAWFQRSLLTSVAINGTAPYRNLYVHGFTLDEEGRKMSKSLGNVIDPDIIINGGKNKKKEPAYGADILRWKIAESNVLGKIYISPEHFTMCSQKILKIRNTLRYCLGNLYDFDVSCDTLSPDNLYCIDRYILHLLYEYQQQVTSAYDDVDFSKVTNLTMNLIYNKISSFYLDTVKDRLYSEASDSLARRSCQTVLHLMLQVLCTAIAPIVPHLAEETSLHRYHGNQEYKSVFKTGWCYCPSDWNQPTLVKTIDILSHIRDTLLKEIDPPKSLEYDVTIHTDNKELLTLLQSFQDDKTSCSSQLAEILMVSYTTVTDTMVDEDTQVGQISLQSEYVHNNEDDVTETLSYTLLVNPASHNKCERCRKFTATRSMEPCIRCLEVLSTGWDT